MKHLICLVIALCTAPMMADEPATQPALVGRWAVQVTPIQPKVDTADTPTDHILQFDAERLEVDGPLGELFRSAPYEFLPPDFRAVFNREEAGNALWAGELINNQLIRGLIIWTRRNGDLEIYRFVGQPTPDEVIPNQHQSPEP